MIKVLLSLVLVALLAVGGYLFLNQPEQPPVEEPAHVHEYDVNVVAPTCVSKGYTQNTCKDCGYVMCDTVVDIAPESHAFTITSVVDSTCTEVGTMTFTCDLCGETRDEEVAMIAHSFSEWTQTVAPTCTENGEAGRACEVCAYPETRVINALGHSWDEGTVTAPTCTEEGYTTYACGACAETKVENKVPATGHDMGEWVLEVAPTCTAEGLNVKYCENGCGHSESQAVDMIAHVWDDGVVTEPTCVAPGYTVYSCKACYTTKTETGAPALPHELGDWYVKTEPKCEEEGEARRDCKNCDYYISKSIEATGHDLADWTEFTAPKCEATGEDRKNCKNCDYFESRTTKATGHDLADWTEFTAPKCEATGEDRKNCKNCDYFESRTTEATGHKYGDNWYTYLDSTCTEEGEARNDCENGCGEYQSKTIAIHHYEVIKHLDPTCTAEGVHEIYCDDCKDHQVEIIPALGHNYSEWHEVGTSGQEMSECSNCGSATVRNKD